MPRAGTRFGKKDAPQRRRPSAAKAMHDLEGLNRIGIALSETRDVDQLLGLILQKAREITSADAASLYVVEVNGKEVDGGEHRQLRFKLTLCERDGEIDSELFRLFLEAQIYRIAEKPN